MRGGLVRLTGAGSVGALLFVGALLQPIAAQQPDNQRFMTDVRARIAGRENEPAGAVFANVDYLKDVPVERFLLIMDVGYARGLGVSCAHCHVTTDFASDAQRPKRAAREMQQLLRSINQQLGTMKNLRGENTAINCGTCHRGNINPLAVR